MKSSEIEEKEILQSAIARRLVKEALERVTLTQLLEAINTWVAVSEQEELKWEIYNNLLTAISLLNPEKEI